jgi:hypothetical protein
MSQPTRTPTDASPPPSRTADARLGATVARYAFDVGRSHFLSPDRFIPALSSARLARRTADAAGDIANASRATLDSAIEQLKIAGHEHRRLEEERARQPAVASIVVSEINARPGEQAPPGTFRIEFTNTGDKLLSEGLLTIMLDPGSLPELTDRWGGRSGKLRDDETIERWPGARGLPRDFDFLATSVDVQRGVSVVRYVRVRRHGRFALRVKLFSVDLDGDGPWIDVAVVISAPGTTTIDDLSGDNPPGPTAGRCAALAAGGS